MKNYNKILEAVDRGIQLALDDFDDNDVQNIKSKQVQNRDYTKEYLDLMNEVVDLGLPSRTLWCKYNLGVDSKKIEQSFLDFKNINMQKHGKYLKTIHQSDIQKIFIDPNLWFGDFYAWGEIEPNKSKYDIESYKFGNGSGHIDELTKYISSEDFVCNPFNDSGEILTYVDNLTNLQEVDDAAYQNKKLYNYKFHIPTKEQFEELKKYTIYKSVSKYKGINFLAGGVFTSKINGNEIFFPYAGWKNDNGKVVGNHFGYYWSSTLNTENNENAIYLNVYNWDYNIDNTQRYAGFKIRPVINL